MMMAPRRSIRFGCFRLYPEERRLERRDEVVEIGSRAFEILLLLLTNPGEVVSHKELREKVWPRAVVGDVNLRVQVTALRRLLSEELAGTHSIRSITGRGYCFTGPVTEERPTVVPSSELLHAPSNDVGTLIGRRQAIEDICRLLSEKRFVSIVGPGGIGKTSAALVAARAFGDSRGVTTTVVELSSVSNGEHVASSVASVLGLLTNNNSPMEVIIDYFRESDQLLLLDCCEHVIDAVAQVAQSINQACEHVTILITSRETLRVPNEYVYRIQPLDVPDRSDSVTPEAALLHSGVKLFCERAASMQPNSFSINAQNVLAICRLCSSLDGLPLAIELAAAQVHVFGPEGLLSTLDNRLEVLTRGHRTAPPRHKTLRATIDWSYETLSEDERQILRHAALFRGNFAFSQISALLSHCPSVSTNIVSSIANLVDKSLLIAMPASQPPTFRLLDSTKAYGIEKLQTHDEYEAAARRHAEYYLSLFTEPATWSPREPALDALATDAGILDDVRAALDWSITKSGDERLGISLTWASSSLFYQLSFCEEYRQRVLLALQCIEDRDEPDADSEFRLQLALAQADFLTQSLKRGTSTRAYHSTLALARKHGHEARQVQALYGTIVMTTMAGDYHEAGELCEQLDRLSRNRAPDVPMYHRMQALVDTQLGKVHSAHRHSELALSLYGPRVATRKLQDPTRYDARTALTSLQSRILWLVGLVDDAAAVAAQSVEEALTLDHDLSTCCSLASGACPVACWRGDIVDLERYLSMLDALSTEYLLVNWRDQALVYGFALQQQPALLEKAGWWRQFDHLAPSAHETLASVNRRLITPLAIDRARSGKAAWATAEIWRALGEQYLERGSRPLEEVESLFRESVAMSKRQGILSWELRAATSLGKLLARNGESNQAEDVLAAALSRITQGAGTKDVRVARAVLNDFTIADGKDRQRER